LVLLDAAFSMPCCSVGPLWAFGLALGLGAFLGLATQSFLSILARLPRLVVWAVWIGSGALAAAWLSAELGTLAKLDGPHATLARASLAGAALLAPLALALGTTLERAAGRRVPAALTDYRGWSLLSVCLLTFGSAVWADRNVLVGLYPAAHSTLRWLALAAWLVVVTALAGERRRWSLRALSGIAPLAVLPWLFSPAASQLTALVDAPLPGLVVGALRAATDFDRDGFSGMLEGGDCGPFDAGVRPGAREVPNNGLDDNCLVGDARHVPVSSPQTVPVPAAPAPVSVVLITVDTLRADRMSVYGHSRNTTPRIAAWAERAMVFDRAFTSGGWTSIAVPSMLYGLYPRRLGWTRIAETSKFRLLRAPVQEQLRQRERIRGTFTMPLETEYQPLAWWLRRRGMHTMAVVNDGYSQFLAPRYGCAKGFERYRQVDKLPYAKRDDAHTSQLALEELELAPKDKPFFLWVHYFGPHDPTTKHAGIETFGRVLIDRYDHEIRAADTAIGVLLERLEVAASERPIAVVLTADHGEWFKSKGRQHGRVTPDVTHVPLIVRHEGWPVGRSPAVASVVDVMPTILTLTETPVPAGLDGVLLRDLFEGRAQRSVAFAETWSLDRDGDLRYHVIAAVDAELSLLHDQRKNTKSLFRTDPAERRDEDLLGSVEHGALQLALDQFLEANSVLSISD
jgi:arylsulfatase A-like enzyme